MKRFSVLSILGTIAVFNVVHAAEVNPADKKIQIAFAHCEQGLMLPTPISEVGLKVLQRYFKKYETYRNAATVLNPNIVKSETLYKSKYPQLGDRPYKVLYDQCQNDLVAKISYAQEQVGKRTEHFRNLALQQAEITKKLNDSVMPSVKSAIELCGRYVQTPLTKDVPDKVRNQFNADMMTYQHTKKHIIKTHPGILQLPYKSLKRDPEANTITELEQVLLHWFEYCDSVFLHSQSADIDAEGPPLPDQADHDQTDHHDSSPADSDDNILDTAAVLAEAIKNAQGDRKKVLEQEQRLADLTDNDDDPANAKTWLFDNTGKDGSECHLYLFDKEHKIITQKITKGLCELPK